MKNHNFPSENCQFYSCHKMAVHVYLIIKLSLGSIEKDCVINEPLL